MGTSSNLQIFEGLIAFNKSVNDCKVKTLQKKSIHILRSNKQCFMQTQVEKVDKSGHAKNMV